MFAGSNVRIASLSKLKRKMKCVRKKGVVLNRRSLHESFRESIAREFVVRSYLLPIAKKVFGSKLKSVLLFGSAQRVTRRATLKNPKSDIDVVFVASSPFVQNYVFFSKLEELVRNHFGFDCNCKLYSAEQIQFIWREKKFSGSFQVIFGEQWVSENLSKEYLAEIERQKKKLKKRKK